MTEYYGTLRCFRFFCYISEFNEKALARFVRGRRNFFAQNLSARNATTVPQFILQRNLNYWTDSILFTTQRFDWPCVLSTHLLWPACYAKVANGLWASAGNTLPVSFRESRHQRTQQLTKLSSFQNQLWPAPTSWNRQWFRFTRYTMNFLPLW